jgi:O-antigen/teichoic acid export membrane protein
MLNEVATSKVSAGPPVVSGEGWSEISPLAPIEVPAETGFRMGNSDRTSKAAFAGHLVIFGVANLAALAANGVLTFLLPRLLTVENYGLYRIFILYGGFTGIFHLGLLDGALIRWSARPQELPLELSPMTAFLLVQQCVLLPLGLFALWLVSGGAHWIWLALAVTVYALVWNWATLSQCALQAAKQFGWLSFFTLVNPVVLLLTVLALHWARRLTLDALIIAFILSWFASGVGSWVFLRKRFAIPVLPPRRIWDVGIGSLRLGWGVLLANCFTSLAIALDRVFVSSVFPIRKFAIYGFAANALAVINTLILSMARVVFPYLSDGVSAETRTRAYAWGEAALVGLWAMSLAGYFPLRALIVRLLPAYSSSLPVLRVLMLTTGLTGAIYILHANYFRCHLRQGRMLLGATLGLTAAALFLSVALRTGRLENMAWAMLGSALLWWLADELLLRDLTGRGVWPAVRTLLVGAACGAWFLACANGNSWRFGLLAYCSVAGALVLLAYRSSFNALWRQGFPSGRRLSLSSSQ